MVQSTPKAGRRQLSQRFLSWLVSRGVCPRQRDGSVCQRFLSWLMPRGVCPRQNDVPVRQSIVGRGAYLHSDLAIFLGSVTTDFPVSSWPFVKARPDPSE